MTSRKAIVIMIALLLMSITLAAIPVYAQLEDIPHGGVPNGYKGPTTIPAGKTADFTFNPVPYISFTPNPVGIGQKFLVNVWTTPPPAADRFLAGFKITITKADQSVDTITVDSYVADGTAWFEYTADQVGTWKLKFEFPGEYFPAGRYSNGLQVTTGGTNYLTSHYYAPASTPDQILTVQTEQVMSWYSPLPTDYWTRPISPENREWYAISGNFPWAYYDPGAVGAGRGRAARYYGPFITAPNTAHILWRRLGALSGIIGGEGGQYSTTNSPPTPSVIYAGRCYQTEVKPGVGSVAVCYDLRTGEVYYEIPIAQGGVTPTRISYLKGVDTAVPGAGEAATVLTYLLSIGSRLITINPFTGAVITNVTGIAGADYRYFHSNNYVLTLQDLGASAGANRYRLINWTTLGTSDNFTSRIISNITWPLSTIDLALDFNSGVAVQQNRFIYGQVEGGNFVALSLKTGQILWNITTEDTPFNAGTAVADYGKYAYSIENKGWRCYDQITGKQLWTTPQTSYPWGSFYGYYAASAYGLLYAFHYDGVHAYDWNNGKEVWSYIDPAVPYETPYTMNYSAVYSFRGPGIVADGKLYIHNTEHTPTRPETRGWNLHCINATTGKGLWNITYPMIAGAASDGYLTAASSYDGYMYVFGKGKSATTVTAPTTDVAKGTKIVIQGTILDQSPAQPGTPCISKNSMATYMEFLHMQKPIPTGYTVEGVPVQLFAIDENNNVIEIGSTTSDVSGTFGITWTPPNEGLYRITANFAGDDSYGSSWAETRLSVGPAVEQPKIPEQPTPQDYTMTIVGVGIAVIIAIAIVGIALFFALRKR